MILYVVEKGPCQNGRRRAYPANQIVTFFLSYFILLLRFLSLSLRFFFLFLNCVDL